MDTISGVMGAGGRGGEGRAYLGSLPPAPMTKKFTPWVHVKFLNPVFPKRAKKKTLALCTNELVSDRQTDQPFPKGKMHHLGLSLGECWTSAYLNESTGLRDLLGVLKGPASFDAGPRQQV